jgi:hypothetical protein
MRAGIEAKVVTKPIRGVLVAVAASVSSCLLAGCASSPSPSTPAKILARIPLRPSPLQSARDAPPGSGTAAPNVTPRIAPDPPATTAPRQAPITEGAPGGGSSTTSALSSGFRGSSDLVTTLDGNTTTLAQVKGGGAALVWFVSDGCASCSASVPVIASHLADFANAGVKVVALGMYGFFAPGSQGLAELASFVQQTAPGYFSNPDWAWAMASESLMADYDPQGNPDEYFLVDASGRIVYQGSVPVSSIGALLSQVRKLSAG